MTIAKPLQLTCSQVLNPIRSPECEVSEELTITPLEHPYRVNFNLNLIANSLLENELRYSYNILLLAKKCHFVALCAVLCIIKARYIKLQLSEQN